MNALSVHLSRDFRQTLNAFFISEALFRRQKSGILWVRTENKFLKKKLCLCDEKTVNCNKIMWLLTNSIFISNARLLRLLRLERRDKCFWSVSKNSCIHCNQKIVFLSDKRNVLTQSLGMSRIFQRERQWTPSASRRWRWGESSCTGIGQTDRLCNTGTASLDQRNSHHRRGRDRDRIRGTTTNGNANGMRFHPSHRYHHCHHYCTSIGTAIQWHSLAFSAVCKLFLNSDNRTQIFGQNSQITEINDRNDWQVWLKPGIAKEDRRSPSPIDCHTLSSIRHSEEKSRQWLNDSSGSEQEIQLMRWLSAKWLTAIDMYSKYGCENRKNVVRSAIGHTFFTSISTKFQYKQNTY